MRFSKWTGGEGETTKYAQCNKIPGSAILLDACTILQNACAGTRLGL
jgi:hypothetical protein